jgi:DNA polymerase-3 subunit alpha
MGKKIKSEMDAQRKIFVDGCKARGLDEESASLVYDKVAKFADYGFNKSHAACYAVLAFRTAYLRCHHPHEFIAAIMNFEIGDIEKIAVLVNEARSMGVAIAGVDVNRSNSRFMVERKPGAEHAVCYGLSAVKGVGAGVAIGIEEERRKNGPYKSFGDFLKRTGPFADKKTYESLIKAGALDCLHQNRMEMMVNIKPMMDWARKADAETKSTQTSLFGMMPETQAPPKMKKHEDMTEEARLRNEFEVLGYYFNGHPVQIYRSALDDLKAWTLAELMDKNNPTVRGGRIGVFVAEVEQKMTKSRQSLLVLHVSDETGDMEIVAFGDTANKIAPQIRKGECMVLQVDTSDKKAERGVFVRSAEPMPEMILSDKADDERVPAYS